MIVRSLVAAALVTSFGLGAAAADDGSRPVTHFRDGRIVESSGLVVVDGLLVTTNDSGDSGRVFTVDPATGATVGVTHWSDDPHDVEALAPAGPGQVWVGDIGDNTSSRSTISVARIPVGRGDQTVSPATFTLAYPDGPHNAETLLSRAGRLYVATKDYAGGTVYAAPTPLGRGVNRLRAIGHVLPVATDGSFSPDGRLLVVRNYFGAVVYRWPSLARLGDLTLPPEQQGEGLAIGPDWSVWLSSEGLHSDVLRLTHPWFAPRRTSGVPLPAEPPGSASVADPSGSPVESPARPGQHWSGPRVAGAVVAALLAAVAVGWAARRRR